MIFNPMNFGSVGEQKMSVRPGSRLLDKENLLIIKVSLRQKAFSVPQSTQYLITHKHISYISLAVHRTIGSPPETCHIGANDNHLILVQGVKSVL